MFALVEISVSLGVLIVLILAISFCACGCKNSNQKSELVGTAGVVKIRFDEEVASPSPTTPASVKRASTQNSQRSLPEIPQPVVGRHDSGDTASEIYATVNLDEGNKVVAGASTSRDHPYEHAYAKLQNESHDVKIEVTLDQRAESEIPIDERDASQSGPESVVISASVAISGQLPSSQELPYITPPSPRPNVENNVHFSGDSTDSAKGYTSISVREPLSNIRAQSTKVVAQPHYATVSDDSDEMYAAIEEASMGEGSDTYAQINPEPRRRETSSMQRDPRPDLIADTLQHSTRRSAPPEICATTSNATHSRQASTSSSGVDALGSPKPEKRQANSPLPPPPSTSKNQTHQRISSTGDLYNNDRLRRSLNEKHQRNNSCVSSSDFYGCNYPVDKHRFSSGDLTRPLIAKELNFDIDQKENPADNLYNSIDGPNYSDYSSADANTTTNSEQRVTESPSRNVEEMYAKVVKKTKTKHEEIKRKSSEYANNDNNAQTSKRGDDPGYETIDRKKSVNHGYETIARQRINSQNQDPGYETVKEYKLNMNANFSENALLNRLNQVASESGPNSLVSSDPGYEHISKNDHNASDSDPNYEVLRNQPPTPPYATIASNYKIQPTYSTVNKRTGKFNDWAANNNEPIIEPNYESMPHDPLYTTGSESDPNYESVRPKDSNYESFNAQDPNYESLRCKDPKYESLRSKDSKYDSMRSKKDPNYESVKYFDVEKKDPPYEKVDNGTTSSQVERSDSGGYERINVANNRDNKHSISNGTEPVVDDYFQV